MKLSASVAVILALFSVFSCVCVLQPDTPAQTVEVGFDGSGSVTFDPPMAKGSAWATSRVTVAVVGEVDAPITLKINTANRSIPKAGVVREYYSADGGPESVSIRYAADGKVKGFLRITCRYH